MQCCYLFLSIVQVYDTQATQRKDSYSVNALYSVARVRWRPQNRNHLIVKVHVYCSHMLRPLYTRQCYCRYFDLQATLLPRIETCSILGNTLLTTSK